MQWLMVVVVLALAGYPMAQPAPTLNAEWRDRVTLQVTWDGASPTATMSVAGIVRATGSAGTIAVPLTGYSLGATVTLTDGNDTMTLPIPPVPMFAALAATWRGATLELSVDRPGCIIAQPGYTGTGWCSVANQPWVASIPRYGDQFTAASTPGRWYELYGFDARGQYGLLGQSTVPPIAVLHVPLITAP